MKNCGTFFAEKRDGGLNAGYSSEHSSSLNSAFAQYGANITNSNSNEKTFSMQKLKWYFVRVYPYLHMTNEGLNIAYQWVRYFKLIVFQPLVYFIFLVVV